MLLDILKWAFAVFLVGAYMAWMTGVVVSAREIERDMMSVRPDHWCLLDNSEVGRLDLIEWLIRYRNVAHTAGSAPIAGEPRWLANVPFADGTTYSPTNLNGTPCDPVEDDDD